MPQNDAAQTSVGLSVATSTIVSVHKSQAADFPLTLTRKGIRKGRNSCLITSFSKLTSKKAAPGETCTA